MNKYLPKALLATLLAMFAVAATSSLAADDSTLVKICRVPDGGLQPQAVVDSSGRIHLISMRGPADAADVYYARSEDGGETFSPPLRVNSHDGSAMAIGTVRGAHLALGKAGRPHVAWMGSAKAEPKAPEGNTPFLYTRLADNGSAFEPERNLIKTHVGLNGGGSLAAAASGSVWVGWHAPASPKGDEQSRQVWLVRSTDDGQTFADETESSPASLGACGCCGMRLQSMDDGTVLALFRSARAIVNRDMYLLVSSAPPSQPLSTMVAPMTSGTCVMSTAAMAPGPAGSVLAAWETNQQIYWGTIRTRTHQLGRAIRVPREGSRKHPALAANSAGQVLVAWAEGTGWMKGGSVAWQLFDDAGRPVKTASGRKDGLPTWSLPAVAVRPDGGFVLLY